MPMPCLVWQARSADVPMYEVRLSIRQVHVHPCDETASAVMTPVAMAA